MNNFFKFLLIFIVIFAWIFSGWPQIWKNPSVPPEIQKAQALYAEGAGILTYSLNGNKNFISRLWSNDVWAASSTIATEQQTIRWVITKASPTRQEIISLQLIASSTSDAVLVATRWSGGAWTVDWCFQNGSSPVTTYGGTTCKKTTRMITNASTTMRGFDLAYEQVSGDAMVMYSSSQTGANKEMDYLTWNGSNWSATSSADSARISGIVTWIELTPKPGSNEITSLFADTAADLSTLVWDGSSSWGTEPGAALETTLENNATSNPTVKSFDGEYESLSGDYMAAWGFNNSNGFKYSRRSSSSATWGNATSVTTQAEVASNVDLAADPLSNQIIFASDADDAASTSYDELIVSRWTGSAWAQTGNGPDTSVDNVAAGNHEVAVGWLTDEVNGTKRGIVIFADSAANTNIDWMWIDPNAGTPAWTAGSEPTTLTSGISSPIQIFQNPFNNAEFMAIIQKGTALHAWKFTLDNTTINRVDTVTGSLGTMPTTSVYNPSSFAYFKIINLPPAAPTRYNVPFRAEETPDQTPSFDFSAADPDGNAGIIYQIQVATSTLFNATTTVIDCASDTGCTVGSGYFTNTESGGDESPFNEEDIIRFTASTTLETNSEDTAYYWRVRAKDALTEEGSGQYGSYIAALSFRVKPSLSQSQWMQTTGYQFLQNFLNGTQADTVNHQVGLRQAGTSTYFLDGDSYFAWDNQNLDSGEGFPPGDWTNIGASGDYCFTPLVDGDLSEVSAVSATAYDDMASDNDVPYISQGTGGDFSCIGTAWVINESTSTIGTISIITNSWITTAANVNFYVKNWNTGNYVHLSTVNITSTGSPGENNIVNITSNFGDYIDEENNMRLVFIVQTANVDWSVDLLQVDVGVSTSLSGSMRGRPITFSWVPGQAAWYQLNWTENESVGILDTQVWYASYSTSTICEQIIPDGALPGNSDGFDSGPVNLYNLSTSTYNRICARALLTDSDGTPYLNDWTITWTDNIPSAAVSCSVNFDSTSFTLNAFDVSTSSPNVTVSTTCTYTGGCSVYVKDTGSTTHPGLWRSAISKLIPSPNAAYNATATLAAGVEGYGIQATSTANGSGQSLIFFNRYNVTGNTVGGLSVTDIVVASSTGSFTGREVLVRHKAAIADLTPTGAYSDTITYSCLGN